jgi:serine/threonine protein kinase
MARGDSKKYHKKQTQEKTYLRQQRRQVYEGKVFGQWTITDFLGEGGNGSVWSCKNPAGQKAAIKILKFVRPKAYSRFVDETVVLEQNSDISGIIPIRDKDLPVLKPGVTPFYVMPIAEKATRKLWGKTIEEKIEAILSIASVITELHKRKIFHRDIKPANLLYYNGSYCIADFGLVDFPDKKDISKYNEEIGPKWTMAPEMKRESSNADLAKVDVYSLAKTLYILLTNNDKCFDGQYSTDSIFNLQKHYPGTHTTPIDNLLIACTDNDPGKRPTIENFIERLEYWRKLNDDFHSRNQQEWVELQAKLFPASVPKHVEWTDLNEIVKVLKTICAVRNLNHMFLPDYGGLDLMDARLSYEPGCIELDFSGVDIVKPRRLLFESFGDYKEWNYFRLDLDNLQPLALNENDENELLQGKETVSETSPGVYHSFYVLKTRAVDNRGVALTWQSRYTKRWFRGSFVIFCKRSIYNLDKETYDGRHGRMSSEDFRVYIEKCIRVIYPPVAFATTAAPIVNDMDPNVSNNQVFRCRNCGCFIDRAGDNLNLEQKIEMVNLLRQPGVFDVIKIDGKCCYAYDEIPGDQI